MHKKFLWLLSAGHMFTDLNQGALPAMLPFLIAERGLSYAEAAGLVFAATCISSVVQPLIGWYADSHSKSWLMSVGLTLAGTGTSIMGFLDSYAALFAAASVSGIGIAAFHPEAARRANLISGKKKGAGISIFAVGGNAGFALGPVFTTPAILFFGLHGTALLLLPAFTMAVVLFFATPSSSEKAGKTGASICEILPPDDWNAFSRLTLIIIFRSIMVYGLNTFVPLYWIHQFGQTEAAAGTALFLFFLTGAAFTLFGGHLGDNAGYVRTIRISLLALTACLFLLPRASSLLTADACLIAAAVGLFAIYSPTVVLGQKYLPHRIGTASGVTIGLSTSIGGMCAPLLGRLADAAGLPAALDCVFLVSLTAAAFSFLLKDRK